VGLYYDRLPVNPCRQQNTHRCVTFRPQGDTGPGWPHRIYSKHDRYHHGTGENGELWVQSRALLALLAYYELTGDESYLTAVEDAVHLTMQHYGPGRSYFHLEGRAELIHLLGLTHGLCYVDLLEFSDREAVDCAGFSRIPFRRYAGNDR
jgi:hypothetical protein